MMDSLLNHINIKSVPNGDVLGTHDYDKSKIIKNNNDNEHNFEKSKSNEDAVTKL